VRDMPRKPTSPEELTAGTSDTKKSVPGTAKKHVGADRSSVSTKGHQKARQRLLYQCQDGKIGPELTDILLIKDPQERSKRLAKLALAYDIDLYRAAPWSQFLADSKGTLGWSAVDPCQIVDEAQEILRSPEGDLYRTRPDPVPDKLFSILLYPIHISVSPLASERDVLDYVAKRWHTIRALLDTYQKEPPVIRKGRKDARDRFIYENLDVRSKKLAEMVNQEFPGESLGYDEVNIIKQRLRKRHSNM